MKLKRTISGIQSSGKLHLGNYLGSISNFVKLQNDYEMYLFIADLHAITLDFDPKVINSNSLNIASTYLASGINPKKVNIFIQSQVCEHTTLGYILMCHTNLGELERMTQYKNKITNQDLQQSNNTKRIPTGLLIYPTLMSADILLYQPHLVPVGIDQKQHLELTRDIALRFNKKYGETFIVPEPFIASVGNKIMDLVEPTKKMSKSSKNKKGIIFLDDSMKEIEEKIKTAKTDSLNNVRYNISEQPNISNLMTIYLCSINDPINYLLREQLFNTNKEINYSNIELKYKNKDYREFKIDLIKIVSSLIKTIQDRKKEYSKNDILKILDEGKNKAKIIAKKTLGTVYEKIGFTIS
ncbi:tryptophan--tRNA ligase [Mycoplasmoides alvi]|uniref:tryptophan--tRNA ligase n=1 Tax=Mycoplasmoides alvi TaxID=78580 RepID=UPI00051ADFF5|nr:tryptophan--tRNA ligase [Mycoplasmoides alvi]